MELLNESIAICFFFFLTDIEWVPEERITLFTSDGLVQIGGNMVPRRIKSSHVCNFIVISLALINTSVCALAWNFLQVQN